MDPEFFSTSKDSDKNPRQAEQSIPNKSLNVARKRLEKAIAATEEARQLQEEMKTLHQTYEIEKKAQASLLNLYNFFASSERVQEIDFITSVAKSLNLNKDCVHEHTREVRLAAEHLERLAPTAKPTIQGACIFILEEIEANYKKATLSKNPHNLILYQKLSMQIGKMPNDEKIICLKQLQAHMEATPTEEINYGTKSPSMVSTAISTQIDALGLASGMSTLHH